VVVGPRRDYGRQALLPHSVPFVLLGAALLWFGWFGFNAGSALGANTSAALAFTNTMLAPIGALAAWMTLDHLRTGRVTAVGAATGIVVGLVAVTPAAGFAPPMGALLLGAVAALPCYFGILWRSRTRLDDSLDVVAAHGVGGTVGALMTGVLASAAWGGTAGALEGNVALLGRQAVAVLATLAYSGTMSFALLRLLGALAPLRLEAPLQGRGLDVALHGEEAYGTGEGAILVFDEPGDITPAPAVGALAAEAES
jgi:Amt family ammonium transporter